MTTTTKNSQIYDLLGVGFGPSNIALAIAMSEECVSGQRIDSIFLEKQSGFAWHESMLLPNTRMQVSFLKDLATLRNPSSRFTFLNYLHEKNRLQDFINLKTFFPSRREFSDYLAWAAAQFGENCVYGEKVIEVLPELRGENVVHLRIRSIDYNGMRHERVARNLIVSVGGMPNIPEKFLSLAEDSRVFHSSQYLKGIKAHGGAKHIALLGAGQSAAEIFMNLQQLPSCPKVDLLMRGHAIKSSDDSPFVNEIFNAEFVDFAFNHPHQNLELLREFKHTNYAAPDLALIENIFNILYEQKVSGEHRNRLLNRREITRVEASRDGIRLTMIDMDTHREIAYDYDAVILCTGYTRDSHKTLLAPISNYLENFAVTRNYRLKTAANFLPAIFLQGACEASHGISDTLLSVIATRASEICSALSVTN